jgi:hypothetical protein
MNRQGFIGGSDATKIMRGDWYDLWMIKTGRNKPDDLTDVLPVQLGILTENFNLNWFEKQHDKMVQNHQFEYQRTYNGVPYKGTIDGTVSGTNALIEAKHTHGQNTMDNVIEYYMPQIQLYMWLAEAEGCYMSVIFGNNKWETAYVSSDNSYQSVLLDACADFWGHVEADDEPIGFNQPIQADINRIAIDDMVKRDATTDNEFVDAAITYINYKQHNAVFENAKKTLKEMVADNEREVYCDYLTIRRDKRGTLRINERKAK